jgi:hypothetical protein
LIRRTRGSSTHPILLLLQLLGMSLSPCCRFHPAEVMVRSAPIEERRPGVTLQLLWETTLAQAGRSLSSLGGVAKRLRVENGDHDPLGFEWFVSSAGSLLRSVVLFATVCQFKSLKSLTSGSRPGSQIETRT